MTVPRQESALCSRLSPQEADLTFFPGSGGKPTKAKILCNSCPLVKDCLFEAIELKLEGFYAGTTPEERRIMAIHYHTPVRSINDIVVLNLPKSVGKRRVYRKLQPENLDTLDFLGTLEGPLLT